MTRRSNSRLAGLAFLLYIVFGIADMMLTSRATRGEGVTAKLASAAQHVTELRLAVLCVLLTSFCAIVLGVTLWAITRERDRDLAAFALVCRVCEGLTGALGVQRTMGLMWLTSPDRTPPDAATVSALGTWLLRGQGGGLSAVFFAIGSTSFSWLLLRGRMIPAALAWWGVFASVASAIVLPLEMVGWYPASAIWYVWLAVALYEIPLAFWLLFRGAAAPAPAPAMAS